MVVIVTMVVMHHILDASRFFGRRVNVIKLHCSPQGLKRQQHHEHAKADLFHCRKTITILFCSTCLSNCQGRYTNTLATVPIMI
jgi:hypothetical protein